MGPRERSRTDRRVISEAYGWLDPCNAAATCVRRPIVRSVRLAGDAADHGALGHSSAVTFLATDAAHPPRALGGPSSPAPIRADGPR